MTKLAASQVSAVSIPLPFQVYEEKVRAYVRGEGTSHWAMFCDVKLKPRCTARSAPPGFDTGGSRSIENRRNQSTHSSRLVI